MDGVLELILCDIGNTTFHFLINEEHKKFFLNEKLPKFNEMVYFISVNENATSKLKVDCEQTMDIQNLIDFKTSYVGMGVDRMVACVGYDEAVIIDAGSAITVDIMSNGLHEGGFIMPGLKNFEEIYSQISSKLDFDINLKVNLDKIPLHTKDAISYSILKSIILPIKEIVKNKTVIFTGGDGKFLSHYFENSMYKEDLIFENMKGIIDANNCIA
jgi:type III pantothenate kinase